MAGPSKRVRCDYAETLEKWLDESDSDASDIECVPKEVCIVESEYEELSDLEPSGGESELKPVRDKSAPACVAKKRNIGILADPLSLWNMLFTDEISSHIIQWTNKKIASVRTKYARPNKPELRDVDLIEFRAFIGVLIYTSLFNSNHESLDTIFTNDGTGRDIFRSVISQRRFRLLLSCLRFDNPEDRDDRKKQNPAAAILDIFERFIENCHKACNLSFSASVGEMLLSFRGRCPFKMYVCNKPGVPRYGIKLMCLADAESGYLYNAYIYCGKGTDGAGLSPEEKKLPNPTQAVLRLAKPLFGTKCNITAGSAFSSTELAELLLKKGLTYVGPLKKIQEIPAEFSELGYRQLQHVNSTIYAYRENISMIHHLGETGKSTLLISTVHVTDTADHIDTYTPGIIEFYKANKGGVNFLAERCRQNSTNRRTRRWPMVIFFRIVDISIFNSFILHQWHKDNTKMSTFKFAKELARQLVEENLKRRMVNPYLLRDTRSSIRRILGVPEEDEIKIETYHEQDVLEKRKVCHLCPSKLRRKTKYLCLQCKKPICLQCTKHICLSCTDKM